jgi:hypothetical protein
MLQSIDGGPGTPEESDVFREPRRRMVEGVVAVEPLPHAAGAGSQAQGEPSTSRQLNVRGQWPQRRAAAE